MRSRLEQMSDTQLSKYLKYARKIILSSGIREPRMVGSGYFYYDVKKNQRLADMLFKSVIGTWNRFDIEYLFFLLVTNDEDSETLSRPELKEYTVRYDEHVRIRKVNVWETSVDSYLELDETDNWDYIYDLNNSGEIEFFDNLIDEDIRDEDSDDGEISDVF